MCNQIHKAYDKNQVSLFYFFFLCRKESICVKSARRSDTLFLLKEILSINTFKTSNKNKARTEKQSLEDVRYSCSTHVSSCRCEAWVIP